MTKPSREDVLNVSGGPVAFVNDDYGIDWVEGVATDTGIPLYTEAQALAIASAMYAAGAEDMRERASALCKEHAFGWSTYKDHQGHAFAADNCATTIRALPITTNTEGEQA